MMSGHCRQDGGKDLATLEKLVLELTAETKGLQSELKKASSATSKATDTIEKSVEDMSEGSTQNITAFQNAMSTMAGFVGGQLVIGAFSALKDAAVGLFNTMVTDGVAAAQAQEDSINKLNAALARTGIFTKETSTEMQAYASQLQKVTRFGDELLLENMALIQSLGGLEKDGLKRATQAAADLSAALGIDLKAAATLVGKAATGEVSSFSRYGVAIKTGKNAAETFTNTLNELEKKFGGAAQADVKTYSGLTQQLENSFGDLTEEVGFYITKNQVLLSVMNQVNTIINEMSGSLNENQNAMQLLVGEGIIFVIDSARVLTATLDLFARTLEFIAGLVNAVLLPIGALVAGFKALTQGTEEAAEYMNANIEQMKKQLTIFGEDGETSFTKITDSLADMSVAGRMAMDEIASGSESAIEPMNAIQEKVEELTEAEKKRADQLTNFSEALLTASESQSEMYAQELEDLSLQLEEKTILEDEYWANRLEMLEQRHAEESELLKQARATDKITESEYQKAKTQLEKQQNLESRKLALQRDKQKEKMDQLRLKGEQQFQQGVMTLTQSGNKQVAGAAKALATFQATTSAIVAIQNALAGVPYPANIAAAAGIGVQAFANVARINGIALNKGGTVPGGGANRDTVPAMLTPGEEVVNRSTADMLREFLSGQREGGNIRLELSMNENIVEFIEARILERQRIGVSLITTGTA